MEDILLYFAIKYHGDFNSIYNALMNKEKVYPFQIEKVKEEVNCKYTTILSDDYPEELKQVYYPPFVLFYQGNLELFNKETARDFRCIHGSSRFYYTSRNNSFLLGVENKEDLPLVYSTLQDFIHRSI